MSIETTIKAKRLRNDGQLIYGIALTGGREFEGEEIVCPYNATYSFGEGGSMFYVDKQHVLDIVKSERFQSVTLKELRPGMFIRVKDKVEEKDLEDIPGKYMVEYHEESKQSIIKRTV